MIRILATTLLTAAGATSAFADPGHGAALGHVHWSAYAAIAAVIAAPVVFRKLRKSS